MKEKGKEKGNEKESVEEKTSGKEDKAQLKDKDAEMLYEDGQAGHFESTFIKMIIYLILMLLVGIVGADLVSHSEYMLTKAMRNEFIHKYFLSGLSVIRFEEINAVEHFWEYCQGILTDGLHWEYWYDDDMTPASKEYNKILFENTLLGVVRIRQLRVRKDSCMIQKYISELFSLDECYGGFSRKNEDSTDLTTRGSRNNIEGGKYMTEEETGSLTYQGKLANYHGGGIYENIGYDVNKTKETLFRLKNELWLTRAARCVIIEFSVYNGNLDLFCVVKIVFEFSPTGGVIPSSTFDTLKIPSLHSTYDYFIVISKGALVAYLVVYAGLAFMKICTLRTHYFLKFWNLMDVIILSLGFTCFALETCQHYAMQKSLENFKNNLEYGNFEKAVAAQRNYINAVAIFLLLVYIKIFQYLSVSKAMAQLNNTLHRCSFEIVSFLVMFSIVFVAYSELGYLLFGTKVMGFRTLGASMFSLYRTILGDFDYLQIEEANKALAPLFFISYILLVFFILMNMFLAIINDTYTEVKTEQDLAPDSLSVVDYLKQASSKFFRRPGLAKENTTNCNKGVIEDIAATLKLCDFTDLEIELFLARFIIRSGNAEENMKKVIEDYLETHGAQTIENKVLLFRKDLEIQQENLLRVEDSANKLTNRVNVLLHALEELKGGKATH